MRFRHLVCAFLFFLAAPLFAKGGVMSGAGKLSVIRTQYFDIIYPVECAFEAEKIASVADGFYEEIAARFETDCRIRFPVSITRSVEAANGYFTVVPYNAIVIQLSPPETSLDQNSDSVTSVFYHELTHAVSTNTRSAFSRFLSAVFGDWFAPAGFLQTNFMHEGTAVSFESLKGEGRVHDPYSRQMVVQCKIDGRFPDWRDVTGARDVFPGGTDAYAFGALFCHYLQETYGMEKFVEFWKTTGSIDGFKTSIARTYGKGISSIWKDFEAWVPVPDSVVDAISAEQGTGDFFVSQGLSKATKTGFSKTNSRRSVFKCIDTSADGVAWFDSKTGGVWYAEYDSSAPKKLFTCAGVSRLSFSDDGRYLAVSYLYADRTTKAALAVYDMQKKSLLNLPIKHVRDGGFVRAADGSLLLACVNISGTRLSIDFYALGLDSADGGKNSGTLHRKNIVLQKQIPFAEGEIPYNPCGTVDGGFACTVKSGMEWKIRLYGADLSCREYGAEKMVLHNLHSWHEIDEAGIRRLSFSFSYAEWGNEKMLPRAGLLRFQLDSAGGASGAATGDGTENALSEGEFVLQDDDVSGSVLDAAMLPASRGEVLVHVAAFYDTQRLMQMDFARRKQVRKPVRCTAVHTDARPATTDAAAPTTDAATLTTDAAATEFPRISYNPFRYYGNLMRLPVGMASKYSRSELDSYGFGYMHLGTAFLGMTVASCSPWQDAILGVSGGYNPFDRYGGTYVTLSGGNDTFSYSANSNVLFDAYGFMQTTAGLSLSKTLYSRFGKSIRTSAQGVYFYGHSARAEADDWSSRARGSVQFSTVHKMSPRYADYGGLSLTPFVLWERISSHYVNVGATAEFRIPGLFPITASGTLFPSSTYAASASATVYLFTWEVQKGLPIALYLDRLYLTASYGGRISYRCEQYFDIKRTVDIFRSVKKSDYSDTVQLRLGAVASVNSGILARFAFDVGVAVQYRPHPRPGEKNFVAGVSAVLVY